MKYIFIILIFLLISCDKRELDKNCLEKVNSCRASCTQKYKEEIIKCPSSYEPDKCINTFFYDLCNCDDPISCFKNPYEE